MVRVNKELNKNDIANECNKFRNPSRKFLTKNLQTQTIQIQTMAKCQNGVTTPNIETRQQATIFRACPALEKCTNRSMQKKHVFCKYLLATC